MRKERRRHLRAWTLRKYGDGTHAPCAGCGELVDNDTMTLDRYPIPGREGGKYTLRNVRPMCAPCNNGHRYEPGYEETRDRDRERSWFNGSLARKERPLSYKIRIVLPDSWREVAKEAREASDVFDAQTSS